MLEFFTLEFFNFMLEFFLIFMLEFFNFMLEFFLIF